MTRVRLGFTANRSDVLAAVHSMGIDACCYSHGEKWADRCDCKYGITDEAAKRHSSEVTGCPELRSLYGVIEALTDDEWFRLVRRAGGSPRLAVLRGDDIGARLHRAEAAAAMAAHNIAEVRDALSEPDHG